MSIKISPFISIELRGVSERLKSILRIAMAVGFWLLLLSTLTFVSYGQGTEPQTITFNAVSAQTVGTILTLNATASSNLTVSFASSTSTVCQVPNAGNAVNFLAAGICTITASQAGNATYAAASPVVQNITVNALVVSPGQSYYEIQTLAGGTVPSGSALNVSVAAASSVVDSSGNIYVCASFQNEVWKLGPTGNILLVIGTGSAGYGGDNGAAASAQLNSPTAVALDSSGSLYIADTNNNVIRKVATSGTITTFAGNGTPGYSGDNGPRTSAELNSPYGIAVDGTGNVYIADSGNNVIRKVATSGTITTFAGNGTPGYSGDNGPATAAELNNPYGLALDTAGNLYIADWNNFVIRKVIASGTISTIAGNGTPGSSGDNGPATSAELDYPEGLAVDSAGDLYIADWGGNRVRLVSSGGTITTFAGNGNAGFGGDGGPAASAEVNGPSGVALDSAGNVYVADSGNYRLRKVIGGTITTFAGNGYENYSGDNGAAASAQLNNPDGVALDSAGNLYIADSNSSVVRKVTTGGVITTIAGTGTYGYSGNNGPATSAKLRTPSGLAVDSAGNLYIADSSANVVRKVATDGTITTVAGNGVQGYGGDNGPATSASLYNPNGVAFDSAGNLYISDTNNQVIRKVAATGIITTIAGNNAVGYGGDNGPATSAELNYPQALAVDSAGNVYIADTNNYRIRKVATTGVMTTIAGNGTQGYTGDNGPATSAEFSSPDGLSVDGSGNLFISDGHDNVVRKVTSGGTITTIAGDGAAGTSGDNGPGTSAELDQPEGVAVGSTGVIYFGDSNSNRVRTLTLVGLQSISVTPPGSSIVVGATQQFVATGSYSNNSTQIITSSVTWSSATTSTATINASGLATGVAAGTTNITASLNGITSPAVVLAVTTAGPTPQTITFNAISGQTVGTPLTLSATASSGLQVSYSSSTTTVCTVSGSTAMFVTAGPCTITASQPGNGTYAAATPVSQTFAVTAAVSGNATTITATSGSGQSAIVSTAFGSALTVVVKDASSNPVANASVTFTAPSSGASGAFAGGASIATALTNTSGTAVSPIFTANGTAGTYSVSATTANATAAATFSLMNIPLFSFKGLPSTEQPGTAITLATLQLSQASATTLSGNVSLSFAPNLSVINSAVGSALPNGYLGDTGFGSTTDNGSAKTTLIPLSVPAANTSAAIPTLDPGTVAGTLTVSFAVSGQTTPTASSITIPSAAPVISDTPTITQTQAGFNVEFTVMSPTLDITSASFTFASATGYSISGANLTVSFPSSAFTSWYNNNPTAYNYGGNFLLTVPFDLSGSFSAIQSVSVTVTNSAGTSTSAIGTPN